MSITETGHGPTSLATWELVFTLVVRTDRGPVRNSSSSFFSSSSTEGFMVVVARRCTYESQHFCRVLASAMRRSAALKHSSSLVLQNQRTSIPPATPGPGEGGLAQALHPGIQYRSQYPGRVE